SISVLPDEDLVLTELNGPELLLTPVSDQYGETSITIEATDGENPAVAQAFSIKILPVNDPPSLSFTQTTFEYFNASTPIAESGWFAFNPGPNEEEQDAAEYLVDDISVPGLFATLPQINAAGELTFQLSPGVNGASTFKVQARDDGGTDNGGNDLSEKHTITVSSAFNQPPTVTTDV